MLPPEMLLLMVMVSVVVATKKAIAASATASVIAWRPRCCTKRSEQVATSEPSQSASAIDCDAVYCVHVSVDY